MNPHLNCTVLFLGVLLALLSTSLSGTSGETPDSSTTGPKDIRVAEPEPFTYRQIGAQSLKAYVFLPKTTGKARPAILLFHGGAWNLGEAAWMFGRAKEFAEKGLVAISVEYRLSKAGLSPIDAVEDTCAAFAWARQQAGRLGIDPRRVAGYGVSAGGHLVAAAATLPSVKGKKIAKSSRPNAILLFSPALNMAHDKYFISLMAGKGDPTSYSPSEFISRTLPPTLIIQGEEDMVVLARDARAFRDAAEKAGARCALYVYPGVGHLLTRNLKVQYKDFDSDPADEADAHQREDDFLVSLGYVRK
jgi:acetyl esterase/lipase